MTVSHARLAVCLLVPALAVSAAEPASRPSEEKSPVSSSPGLGIFGVPAAPLEEPIVTDRPDFTESTDAVPFGHLQLELGYTLTMEREFDRVTRDHTVPEFLLRVGIVKDFELRLGWEGYTYTRTREIVDREMPSGRSVQVLDRDWAQGGSDLSLGTKLKLVEQDHLLPNIAVITELTIPSGSKNMTSGDVEPGVVLCYSWDLNDRFSLSGNTGLFVLRDGTHQFVQTTQSLSLGFEIVEKLGGYIEYFVLAPDAPREDCAHSVNTGLTYQITENLQIDWRIGMGLNEQAPDFFTGVGLALRF